VCFKVGSGIVSRGMHAGTDWRTWKTRGQMFPAHYTPPLRRLHHQTTHTHTHNHSKTPDTNAHACQRTRRALFSMACSSFERLCSTQAHTMVLNRVHRPGTAKMMQFHPNGEMRGGAVIITPKNKTKQNNKKTPRGQRQHNMRGERRGRPARVHRQTQQETVREAQVES